MNALRLLLVVTVLLLPGPAGSADIARVRGVVRNDEGAGLAGVKVTATGQQPGQRFTVTTDESGRYVIEVTPGLYVVTVDTTGFVTVPTKPVPVEAGADVNVDVPLSLLTLDELLDVKIVSATKLEQKTQEAPSVVSVVPRDQLRRYGWTSLDEVLYQQAGFGPARDYDRRTVGARGLFEGWNNNHLLHLVDGIPFNDNLYGTAYTWEVSPLLIVRNVEVLRGPGSALYGTNAANGVVQVNTLRASDIDGQGEGTVRLGNEGLRVLEWVGGYGAGQLVSAVAAFSAHQTDGNEYLSHDGSGRVGPDGGLESFETRDRRSSRYAWVKLEGGRGLAGLTLQVHDQAWDFQTGHGWLWWIPDLRESMEEGRTLAALGYRPPKGGGRLGQEYVLRWQEHRIDWNTRYYPDAAFDSYYPAGMWEYLDTRAHDVFGRAQLSWDFAEGSSLLAGVEADRFLYGGDREHFSNVDVDDASGGFPPFPEGRSQRLGSWLDWLEDRPSTNLAAYAQYSSGSLLERVSLTGGVRWDHTGFEYNDIEQPGRPLVEKSFSRVSPRIGVVVTPSDTLVLKALFGQAFRAPTPTELAGAHTFSLASNIRELRPEVITTGELAAEWRLNRFLNVRASAFHTTFDNQIAYSAANFNLSTNIYSLTTLGTEVELLASRGGYSGYANWSWARRTDEEIIDTTIAPSPDHLTWAPAHRLNLGSSYEKGRWTAAASLHYEGDVSRRDSDVGVQVLPLTTVSLDTDLYRPREVAGWISVDGRLAFDLHRDLTVAVQGTNLLDAEQHLVKVLPFPFDYREEGRRLWVSVQLRH